MRCEIAVHDGDELQSAVEQIVAARHDSRALPRASTRRRGEPKLTATKFAKKCSIALTLKWFSFSQTAAF